jgi:hypothetical protein
VVGLSQTAKVRMQMGMAMKMGDNDLPSTNMPAMLMSFTMKATSVSAEGDIAYELAFSNCGVEESPDANAQMVEMMKEAMAPMSKITGTGVVTSRGFSKDVKIKIPDDMDPTAAGMMDGMQQQMGQVGAPLPAEAVGVGAKWTVATKLKSQGLDIEQVARVELVGIKDGIAAMKVGIEQTAPPNQTIKAPGMPEGMSIKVDSLKSSGTGEFQQSLALMTPSSGTTKIVTDMALQMSQGEGEGQKMTQKVTVEIKLSPGEAAAAVPPAPVLKLIE